ncbi:serine/threonine-protein kinase [Thermosporothrix hazakensis]|uniref:non-specific serine/threonine protein kinase n=2 Tax=Thermosporothrix TaxID=768650 RepID=A0A326UHN0_THEHA|nr:protein kinase [Thermosporothrix hazakensis]PZW27450.1 serine/threonine-protein kinase [Thermosporothrix hazakensis]BBH85958.1 hypothetical protein KTC_07090 [Thermosporothrix sp. COM3]GCE45616.1 hypothetical protein KTH_04850 [Thermosporothrix hazakensis]
MNQGEQKFLHTSAEIPARALVGRKFGRYRIEQLLGKGSLNAVYLARQEMPVREVMMTVFLLPPDCARPLQERFFQRFARISARIIGLQHQHILPILDCGIQDEFPYLVTPFLNSYTLASILKKGRLAPDQALRILQPLAEALEYAHRLGVIHKALRPVNIWLDERQQVQIAGFGLVDILAVQGIIEPLTGPYDHLCSLSGSFLGAPEYIAPEVVLGKPAGVSSDVYSLGAILFEMLSGRPPFSGSDPFEVALMHVRQPMPSLSDVCPDLPASLDLVVQRALEQDPERRFQQAGKLSRALTRVLNLIAVAEQSSEYPVVAKSKAPTTRSETQPLRRIPSQGVIPNRVSASGLHPSWATVTTSLTKVRLTHASEATTQPSTQRVQPSPAQPPRQQPDTRPPASRRKGIARRRVIAALATGGVLLAGAPFAAYFLQGKLQFSSENTSAHNAEQQAAMPPGVIGMSDQQKFNSAKEFVNEKDHKPGILVRLNDGNFVAYESACTHEAGATVHYDPEKQMLICPRHNAAFDPYDNGKVLRGPATKPLVKVLIRVNPDGTITND